MFENLWRHFFPTAHHEPLKPRHDLRNIRALFILKRQEDYSVGIPNFQGKTVLTEVWNSACRVIDAFYAGIQVVTSSEVPLVEVDPASTKSTVVASHNPKFNVDTNRAALKEYVEDSADSWAEWLRAT